MSKSISTKSKPPPWIPPGRGNQKSKKTSKPTTKSKIDDPIKPKISPEKTEDFERKEVVYIEDEPDLVSLISNSSSDEKNEPNIYLLSVFQEMKLLYVHFASIKTSYLSAHRLIDSQNIEDINISEFLNEAGVSIKDLNYLFDDLEYSVSVFENTLTEGQKIQRYSEVLQNKEKLISKLFDVYDKVIMIFLTIFEKQDFKEMAQLRESLSKKLQVTEKKYISQEAIIKDLERRLSIYQSKTNAMESYKTNLETDKAELEKQLMYKESQIKYLKNELMNASGKPTKSDHEDLIEIIETIKSKAHAEKSALKKALKFQKGQSEKNEEKYQKLMQEFSEKDKMMFDLAFQRDQLKVQLTVINNSIIQQKNQMEEMKIQNLKVQNEMTEKDISYKKEVGELQNVLVEKSSLLDNTLKAKKNLEKTIEELEEELMTAKKQLKSMKEETETIKSSDVHKIKETDAIYEEMHRLTSLLQDTKEVFESLKLSSQAISVKGDNLITPSELGGVQNEILAAVKETKEHLLELKNLFKAFIQEEKDVPDQPKKNYLEKQLKKLEELYNESVKENQALKLEVEELKNSSSTVQKTENYFTTNLPSDNFTRKLQLELMKKSDEILKMKYDFKQKERELEDQLKEYKGKLKKEEIDNTKVLSLEEELNKTKFELSILQQKKEEETERLLRRTKELQDSLDLKSAEYESLQRYVQLLKSSYFNVFGGS